MKDLKPCPFCGGKAETDIYCESAFKATWDVTRLRCTDCFAMMTTAGRDVKTVAQRWNKRAHDWQPIETAPKDGAAVLLFEPEELEQFVGYWNAERRTFTPLTSTWETMPTHWKPLPAPPQSPAASKDEA